MGNQFSFLPFLLELFPLALIFTFLLLFFSSDLGLVAPSANQELKFWNYVGLGLAQGMNYNNLLLSIDTETIRVGIDEALPPINNSNTFNTKGLLSTVLFPDYSKINQNLSGSPSTSLNQTSESIVLHNFQKLVSGTWSLNVSRGLVTDFHANFKLLTVNGIDKHFIELLNFQNSNGSSITFNQFSNTPINGFADIKIDDELFQSKFPLTIQIFNINTIVLTIKDETVSKIFYNNNLLGITDSFKNFEGDELLIFEEDEK
ncbi:hypothetical protein [Candidatus Nitrosocosmicus sp. R]